MKSPDGLATRQYGNRKAVRLLRQWLKAPSTSVPANKKKNSIIFDDPASEVKHHYLHHTLLVKTVTNPHRFKEEITLKLLKERWQGLTKYRKAYRAETLP